MFAWTFSFAFLVVLLSFALGLFLAVTLQKQIRFQRLPHRAGAAVCDPGLPHGPRLGRASERRFGVINQVLHRSIPWLFDPWWAKVSIILVCVWLTFPYFFLVSLGALQSIPAELVEAAGVDGAGGLQVFRRITLPLLLIAVAPLLIASFAFNFNNFNVIYMLTKGGPASRTGDRRLHGHPDQLHVQARDRVGQGARMRSRARSRSSSSCSSRRSARSPSGSRGAWKRAMTSIDQAEYGVETAPRRPAAVAGCLGAGRTGGGTWSRSSRSRSRSSRSPTSSRRRSTPCRR